MENHRLQAGREGRRFRPVRPWGLAKWLLVYLVLATEAPFFWVYPGASGWLLILFRAAAAVFGLTAIAGIAAVVLRKDGLLETSLPGMSIGFLLLLSAYLAVLLG